MHFVELAVRYFPRPVRNQINGVLLLRPEDFDFAAVTAEGLGRREFAELVADHILGDIELDESSAVVNRESSSR